MCRNHRLAPELLGCSELKVNSSGVFKTGFTHLLKTPPIKNAGLRVKLEEAYAGHFLCYHF